MLIKHKEDCLSINGVQSVDVEEGIIKFENYSKQLPAPFKIMLILNAIYKILKFMKAHDHVPCSYAFKVVCIDNTFTKPIVVYRGKNAAYEFIKGILKEYKYCRKMIKEHFNKNLIMSEEEEHLFQQSNSWICKKLINHDDEKVRDHCHCTSKYRGAAHWDCNIKFQLAKIFIFLQFKKL